MVLNDHWVTFVFGTISCTDVIPHIKCKPPKVTSCVSKGGTYVLLSNYCATAL